jgi:hypothetical protein
MSQSARFRRGFGRLSPAMLTQMATASERVMRSETAISAVTADHQMAPLRGETILAWITGNSDMDGENNRWEYEWQEIELTSTGIQVMEDGLKWDDADQRPAWNLCEMMNDGADIEGPGWFLGWAPGDFNIRPIRDCCVFLHSLIDDEGEQRWVFQMANVLDGECSEEEEEE